MSDHAVTAEDVETAAAAITPHLVATPTRHSRTLSAITAAEVYLKFENQQYTASFKDRGSLWRIMQLTEIERERGVLAVSAGNHAQGVAYHAGRLGIPATIVMPRFTPNIKVANTEALGATVVLEGEDFPAAAAHARRLEETNNLIFIPPYDDRHVMAGQGTVAREMLGEVGNLDVLVVPVGGGGLIAGMAAWTKRHHPEVQVIGSQTVRWPGARELIIEGAIDAPHGATIADGIAVKTPGALTGPIIRDLVDDVLLVTEAQIEAAIALLIEIEKTVVEGAGAVGLASVLANPDLFAGRKVGLVLSGGNIDPRLLATVLQRSLIRSGRLSRLTVNLRDVPGELARVATIVGTAAANIVEVTHQRMWGDGNATDAVLELSLETRDMDHADEVAAALAAAGYHVRRIDDV